MVIGCLLGAAVGVMPGLSSFMAVAPLLPMTFVLALFAFVATSSVVADSVLQGLASLLLGLGIAVVGIDQVTGTPRFTMDSPQLYDGIPLVTVTVAILALGEVLHVASRARREQEDLRIRGAEWPWSAVLAATSEDPPARTRVRCPWSRLARSAITVPLTHVRVRARHLHHLACRCST